MRSVKGLTLVELLVALGVFVLFVSFLVTFVQSFEKNWWYSEQVGQIFEESQLIWSFLFSDFSALWHSQEGREFPEGMVVDYERKHWTARLRLVRSISESHFYLASWGGSSLYPSAYLDLDRDREEVERGTLRPTGGAMEVVYWLEPFGERFRLLRAFRAPKGGQKSFFRSFWPVPRRFQVLSERVLYWEFRFWHQGTKSWEIPWGERKIPWKKCPSLIWDSTGRLISPKSCPPAWRFLPFFQQRGVLPEAVQVRLVFASPEKVGQLQRAIGPEDRRLFISGASRLPRGEWEEQVVYLGREWIRYEKVEGSVLILGEQGRRGARMTEPKSHPAGTAVDPGKTFLWTFSLK